MNLALEETADSVERRARFDGLPKSLQAQYYVNPVVHMWVSGFLYDKLDRESMLAELASALAIQNDETRRQLIKFLEWFGCPP